MVHWMVHGMVHGMVHWMAHGMAHGNQKHRPIYRGILHVNEKKGIGPIPQSASIA